MNKEDLAEYIIKNLIFITLFVLGAFYAFNSVLLPQIQIYKDKKTDLRRTEFALNQAINENTEITQKIKNTQESNTRFFESLKTQLQTQQIQVLAQEFLKIKSLKKIKTTPFGMFEEITLELQGESNGTKAVFDYIYKLQNTFPNITISLPFALNKKDPLINTLKVTLHLKVTQIAKKS